MIKLSLVKAWTGGILLAWAFTECLRNESERDIWNDPNYAIFMVLGDLLLLLWMWGISLQVWRSSGIAWATLLGLESTKLATLEVPETAVYEAATELSTVYLACFVVFNMSIRSAVSSSVLVSTVDGEAPDSAGAQELATNTSDIGTEINFIHGTHKFGYAHTIPLSLLAFMIYRAVVPWVSRKIWWYHLKCVLCAPLFAVTFRCGYVGDLLTSLVRVLVQALYAMCYLLLIPYAMVAYRGDLSGTAANIDDNIGSYQFLYSNTWWNDCIWLQRGVVPWLTLLPLWVRLMQCLRRSVETGARWPHIANALKYTSAILVISVGTLIPEIRTDGGLATWVWVLAFVGATCYQFAWDITMDWGLLVPDSSDEADTSITLAAALSVQLGQDETDTTLGAMQSRKSVIRRIMQFCFGGHALRRRRLLGPRWVYLTIILSNFVLRFAWTLTLMQASSSNNTNNSYGFSLLMAYLTPLIAAAEVMRRMMWGFLRLEWEYLERLQAEQKNGESDNTRTSDADADRVTEDAGAAGVTAEATVGQGCEEGRELEAPFETFETMRTSGYTSSRGSTTLYGAVDPDGRFHIIAPVISMVRTLVALVVDATGTLAERTYSTLNYICGQELQGREENHPEDTAVVPEADFGYYRRLFENAAWCVYPFHDTLVRRFANKYGSLFGLQPPRSWSQYESLPDHGKVAFAEEDDDITALVSAAADASHYERQSLRLAEGAAFSAVVLSFLFALTIMREVAS